MNHTEVIRAIAEKTGFEEPLCDRVVKAFEEESGAAILGKFGGKQLDTAKLAARIAATTTVPEDQCGRIIAALDEVLDQRLSKKLGGSGGK